MRREELADGLPIVGHVAETVLNLLDPVQVAIVRCGYRAAPARHAGDIAGLSEESLKTLRGISRVHTDLQPQPLIETLDHRSDGRATVGCARFDKSRAADDHVKRRKLLLRMTPL
jgi:hypothetical protein